MAKSAPGQLHPFRWAVFEVKTASQYNGRCFAAWADKIEYFRTVINKKEDIHGL